MKVQLFKQSLGLPSDEDHFMEVEPSDMYAQTPCLDCNATGIFELYEESWACVDCKGAGYQWVSLI